METISEKTVERLIQYKRNLTLEKQRNKTHIFSHQLAALMNATPAQVRRDIMSIGYSGSPVKGYDISLLIKSIDSFLNMPKNESVALIGIGHLGRAILAYFRGRHSNLSIKAAFDIDPAKVDRVYQGCRCYSLDEMETIIKEQNIALAILTVPLEAAQETAERLIVAGIQGILNYAPIKLHLPPDVYIEDRDMILAVEKVAFFTNKLRQKD